MAHLVIYHSVRPLGACLAAALHLERLQGPCPPAGELADTLARLAGTPDWRTLFRPFSGLRPAGRDGAGRLVCLVAPGASTRVTDRALAGLATLAGVPRDRYWLAAVPEAPWALAALAGAGSRAAALLCARLAWPAAAAAADATLAALVASAPAPVAGADLQQTREMEWPVEQR